MALANRQQMLGFVFCGIVCSQRDVLGDTKAKAENIRRTRENQLAYRLFVPHDEDVLFHGCQAVQKATENWLRGNTFSCMSF